MSIELEIEKTHEVARSLVERIRRGTVDVPEIKAIWKSEAGHFLSEELAWRSRLSRSQFRRLQREHKHLCYLYRELCYSGRISDVARFGQALENHLRWETEIEGLS